MSATPSLGVSNTGAPIRHAAQSESAVGLGDLRSVFGSSTLLKGHGTGRDFLVLIDPEGETLLDAVTVRAVCDRRFGIGADGLIRAIRTGAPTEQEEQGGGGANGALAERDTAVGQWFMDLRAADGTAVGMCADGLRVLAHTLRVMGLAPVEDGAATIIGTRVGQRQVTRHGELYTVDLGAWQLPGGSQAVASGADALVTTGGLAGERAALRVEVCGPHAVVALAQEEEFLGLQLVAEPVVEPAPSAGTSIEYVVPLGEEDVAGILVGTARVRVYQPGVGETLSGGAASGAVALALHAWGGADAPKVWRLLLPGGEESVRITGQRVEVTGQARLVARVEAL